MEMILAQEVLALENLGNGVVYGFGAIGPAIDTGLRRFGALIAHETGTTTTYGLLNVEDRGTLFLEPGTDVYEGMIVGEHSRENDLVVNVCKEKHVTNIRSATKEETVKLKSHRRMSLEEALQFLNDDEYCEVTPESVRLRKKHLKKWERDKAEKQKQHK
jgi:GTP-binding protein